MSTCSVVVLEREGDDSRRELAGVVVEAEQPIELPRAAQRGEGAGLIAARRTYLGLGEQQEVGSEREGTVGKEGLAFIDVQLGAGISPRATAIVERSACAITAAEPE